VQTENERDNREIFRLHLLPTLLLAVIHSCATKLNKCGFIYCDRLLCRKICIEFILKLVSTWKAVRRVRMSIVST
jgi:hypothetical protein